jgi:hypothetical protein
VFYLSLLQFGRECTPSLYNCIPDVVCPSQHTPAISFLVVKSIKIQVIFIVHREKQMWREGDELHQPCRHLVSLVQFTCAEARAKPLSQAQKNNSKFLIPPRHPHLCDRLSRASTRSALLDHSRYFYLVSASAFGATSTDWVIYSPQFTIFEVQQSSLRVRTLL